MNKIHELPDDEELGFKLGELLQRTDPLPRSGATILALFNFQALVGNSGIPGYLSLAEERQVRLVIDGLAELGCESESAEFLNLIKIFFPNGIPDNWIATDEMVREASTEQYQVCQRFEEKVFAVWHDFHRKLMRLAREYAIRESL